MLLTLSEAAQKLRTTPGAARGVLDRLKVKKAVSQNMGHADTTMIHRHYQHVLVKQRDEALAVVPNLVIQGGNTGKPISPHFRITGEDEP